jgi:hypothetical protein
MLSNYAAIQPSSALSSKLIFLLLRPRGARVELVVRAQRFCHHQLVARDVFHFYVFRGIMTASLAPKIYENLEQ